MKIISLLQAEQSLIMEQLLLEHERRYSVDSIWEHARQKSALNLEHLPFHATCCMIGSAPEFLRQSYEATIRLLCTSIMDAYDAGYYIFLSSMSRGVELWAAHIILALRNIHPEIRLIAILPSDIPASTLPNIDRQMYQYLLHQVDHALTVSHSENDLSISKHRLWMISHSSRIICVEETHNGAFAEIKKHADKQTNIICI